MAETVIGATVQVLLEKLLAVAAEVIGLVFCATSELKTLEKSLTMVQAFLRDASRRNVENEAVKVWLKNLEDVIYEADHLLDEFNYEIIRRKVEMTNQLKRKVCFSFNIPVIFRPNMARKIKDVNIKLKRVNEEATNYGLQKIVADSAIYLPPIKETHSQSVDPIVLGRENDVSKTVNMLVNPSNEVVSVLPILGMGGLGKTTLARLIFNDTRIVRHFDQRIWVCVSENFDTSRLLKRILETLTIDVVHLESKEAVINKLQEKLKDKRYLLVLDDFWNDQRSYWEDFKSSLLGINPNKGNFCLVTTRSEDVASTVQRLFIIWIKLSDDDCWSIIKARAFSDLGVPEKLQIIGKDIAMRCRGVPLAANIVGGTLRGKESGDWTSFLHSGFSASNGEESEESEVLRVLKVSFDRLPSPSLKKCFAYCSIFPKDVQIKKERLIQLWMAEGFLIENDENDMENIGNRVHDILLQNSFLQEAVKNKFGNFKHSKMHDLVHDVACLVSKSESSTANSISPSHVRYMAIKSLDEETHKITKEGATYVRTLFLGGDKVSDSMFKDFKNLHTLNLQGTRDIELTNSIGTLIHLRFFDVSFSEIEAFPESLCKLLNLQTLRATRCSSLARLPDRFQQFVNLRHLIISYSSRFEMPLEIGKLTCLRTLKFFVVGHEKGRRIEELGSLKNLKRKLMIHNLERVKDKDEASRARLIEKPNILELVFVWSSGEGNNNDEQVLEGLQPHKNIKSLTIKGFSGIYFPLWTLAMISDKKFTFGNLIEIKLVDCKRCQEIPTLGHLPMLKILVLKGLVRISSMSHSFYYPHGGNEQSSTDCGRKPPPFAALERLTLAKMINLVEWIAPTVYGSRRDAFPNLEYLEMEECPKMIIAPILDFPSLKELRVDSVDCGSLLLDRIYGRSLLSLEIIYIGGLACLPKRLLYNSQCLESLKIEGCHSLTHIKFPDNAHNFRSLQELRIIGCHNVMSIQYSNGELVSLRTLRVHQCNGLTDISSAILESCTSLENLEISKCNRLASFSLDCQKMPRLHDLSIIKCPKLRSLPKNIDRLCHLRKLSIGPFSEEDGLISLSETLKSVQGLHSLQELVLYGLRKWESLPDQLQHLNGLTRLELVEFGIQVLPEWLWNLSSLRVIYILDCYMLRHLPPKEVMQRLTQLTSISIKGSPHLKRFEGSQATRHPIVFHQN